jgi:hypothetical protein
VSTEPSDLSDRFALQTLGICALPAVLLIVLGFVDKKSELFNSDDPVAMAVGILVYYSPILSGIVSAVRIYRRLTGSVPRKIVRAVMSGIGLTLLAFFFSCFGCILSGRG